VVWVEIWTTAREVCSSCEVFWLSYHVRLGIITQESHGESFTQKSTPNVAITSQGSTLLPLAGRENHAKEGICDLLFRTHVCVEIRGRLELSEAVRVFVVFSQIPGIDTDDPRQATVDLCGVTLNNLPVARGKNGHRGDSQVTHDHDLLCVR